jgi:tetrahydromethanopterin S-methyltransferase subunit B
MDERDKIVLRIKELKRQIQKLERNVEALTRRLIRERA